MQEQKRFDLASRTVHLTYSSAILYFGVIEQHSMLCSCKAFNCMQYTKSAQSDLLYQPLHHRPPAQMPSLEKTSQLW